MTLYEIADVLNELSAQYKIGKLQFIRKEIKGFQRLPCTTIFTEVTTFEKYAYHFGGRKELQFNIGYDPTTDFRFGIAFSLETSQSLPDVSLLYPKIERFNDYFRKNRKKFDSYSAYTEKKCVIVSQYSANVITVEQYKNHQNSTFFFIGKYIGKKIEDITAKDCRKILETFDDLLDVYLYVEKEDSVTKIDFSSESDIS